MGKRSFIILISEAAAGTVFVMLAIIILARLNVGNVLLYTLVVTMGVLRVVQFILYIRMCFFPEE